MIQCVCEQSYFSIFLASFVGTSFFFMLNHLTLPILKQWREEETSEEETSEEQTNEEEEQSVSDLEEFTKNIENIFTLMHKNPKVCNVLLTELTKINNKEINNVPIIEEKPIVTPTLEDIDNDIKKVFNSETMKNKILKMKESLHIDEENPNISDAFNKMMNIMREDGGIEAIRKNITSATNNEENFTCYHNIDYENVKNLADTIGNMVNDDESNDTKQRYSRSEWEEYKLSKNEVEKL